MDKGFYHPERGYWQVTGDVPEDVKGSYPEGTVEVPKKPAANYDWDGSFGKWVYSDPFTLDQRKDQAVVAILEQHAKMLETLSGGYTSAERDTWTLQLEWARGYLADQNAAHEALLAGMVPASMATTAAADARMMADKIVAKANEYARLTMLAQRTKTEALASVAAAATPADLEAVMAALKDIVASAITELNQPV